jgi:hypothetical protein
MTKWFSADCVPPLTDCGDGLLESEWLLIVNQIGDWYTGYYQQWANEPTGTWYQTGPDRYSFDVTGPYRIRYWRYLEKDHPPLR